MYCLADEMAYEMACVMRGCLADEMAFHKALRKVEVHGERRKLEEGVELPSLLSRLPVFGPTE